MVLLAVVVLVPPLGVRVGHKELDVAVHGRERHVAEDAGGRVSCTNGALDLRVGVGLVLDFTRERALRHIEEAIGRHRVEVALKLGNGDNAESAVLDERSHVGRIDVPEAHVGEVSRDQDLVDVEVAGAGVANVELAVEDGRNEVVNRKNADTLTSDNALSSHVADANVAERVLNRDHTGRVEVLQRDARSLGGNVDVLESLVVTLDINMAEEDLGVNVELGVLGNDDLDPRVLAVAPVKRGLLDNDTLERVGKVDKSLNVEGGQKVFRRRVVANSNRDILGFAA